MFEFKDAPSGPTTIVVQARGLAPAAIDVQLSAGETYPTLEAVLQQAATLRGMILDRFGVPQRAAVITATYGAELSKARTLANFIGGRLRADDDGQFVVGNIVPGVPINVVAVFQGRRSQIVTVTLNPGEDRSGIVLNIN
jgi:hypothetical protein